MSEEAPKEPPKDEHGCIIDKETWDEDSKTCVPIEETTTPTTEGEAIKAPMGLEQRIEAVIKEVLDRKLGASFDARVDKMVEDKLKEKEIEVEKALRKGFGLETDSVVHMSDLIAYGRKLGLDKADTGKRTPAPETPAGPEGNIQLSEVDKMFAKAKKGELA